MADELPDKATIIADAIAGREHELMLYDLNITNYQYAIEAIDAAEHDADPAIVKGMRDHRDVLGKLLVTEKLERAKSQLIRDALVKQQKSA